MDKISKPSQNMKVRQKERCLHKTIYSWLKHICLKARQSYETEIRGTELKNIRIKNISALDHDFLLCPHLQKQTLLNHSRAQSPISCRRLELAQFTLICDKDTSALFIINHLEMNDPIRVSIPKIQTPYIYQCIGSPAAIGGFQRLCISRVIIGRNESTYSAWIRDCLRGDGKS